jgi:hypothetical protein
VWDAVSGQQLRALKAHTGEVISVAWSPDGARLATASWDGKAKVWDAASGRELLTVGEHDPVHSVTWSPDGARLATASADGTAKVWDVAGGRQLLTLQGHAREVWSVAWSPDGGRLATASGDGTAKVWDPAGGRQLLTLRAHTGPVLDATWSSDGKRVATASEDGTAKVWDMADAAAVQAWALQDQAREEFLARNTFRPHAAGFIRDWLLLLPLPLASGETCAQALDRQQVPDEAHLRPRPGEQVLVGGRPLVWQEHRSPEAAVNFNAVLGRVTWPSIAYAVCYIESDRARDGLSLQVGTDDQCAVYFNGRPIYQYRLERELELDTAGPVDLKQGINVLLLKVVNAYGNWECCARLVDEEGRPAQGIRVKLTP